MRIIISPAKKMNLDPDSLPADTRPQFLSDACDIVSVLRKLDRSALQKLWKCSDALTELNANRLQSLDLHQAQTPALFAYEGIQYQAMAPQVLDRDSLAYLRMNLRILSGLYGLLRPFDGIVPYRLEMQSRLRIGPHKNLYDFWGSRLADQLASEADFVLNLASAEYSKAVAPYLPPCVPFITCRFAQWIDGTPVEKSTFCKIARGQMVRWLAQHKVSCADDIKDFHEAGYSFSPKHSSDAEFVFLKGEISRSDL